jgi:hypothetical protein
MRTPTAALVPAYLVVQATIILVWWIVLGLAPATRDYFAIGDWPVATVLPFWIPDTALLIVGSLLAAHGLQAQRAWARPMLWLVAGGAFYATLLCVSASLASGCGWLATAMMLACAFAMSWALASTR